MTEKIELSIVIPAYNEERNVGLLYKKLKTVLDKLNKKYEIIFVDDGSTDKTFDVLINILRKERKVRIIKFRKNFGQTAAFGAGFKNSRGKIIVSMDADLQNDPEDIPKLIKKISEGYDVISGWRYDRKDSFLKKISSSFANYLRKALTGENIHDSGCSLKAYKKECLDGLDLYGEMHRYIPALLMWKGFKISEIKVRHHKRLYGKTKYGLKRLTKGFLDLLVVKFWMQYSARPIHLFGGLGLLSFIIGFIIALYLSIMKLFFGIPLSNRPLLLLSILLVILGVQLFVFGILADIMIKVYYKTKSKENYNIEEIIG